MPQLNLLPDVKLQYIRAKQRKRLVMGGSIIVSGLFLALFIFLLLFVRVAQKQHLSALDKDITRTTTELKEKQDLDKILTIQNQLNSLPELHDEKIISSRLFSYLTQLTPAKATISDVVADFSENTLTISGNADSFGTVNKFADTLKFTKYKTGGGDAQEGNAFTEVVLEDYSIDSGPGQQGQGAVSYEIKLSFEPIIFTNIKDTGDQKPVTLNVPNIISTRSETEKPADLFLPQSNTEEGLGN